MASNNIQPQHINPCWSRVAISVGSLILITGVVFGVMGLLQSHGVISLPKHLASAIGTLSATPHNWSLWVLTIGSVATGAALIAYGLCKNSSRVAYPDHPPVVDTTSSDGGGTNLQHDAPSDGEGLLLNHTLLEQPQVRDPISPNPIQLSMQDQAKLDYEKRMQEENLSRPTEETDPLRSDDRVAYPDHPPVVDTTSSDGSGTNLHDAHSDDRGLFSNHTNLEQSQVIGPQNLSKPAAEINQPRSNDHKPHRVSNIELHRLNFQEREQQRLEQQEKVRAAARLEEERLGLEAASKIQAKEKELALLNRFLGSVDPRNDSCDHIWHNRQYRAEILDQVRLRNIHLSEEEEYILMNRGFGLNGLEEYRDWFDELDDEVRDIL